MTGEAGRPNALDFIIFRDGENMLSAVCVDRFIGAQGSTMEEVQTRLKAAYRAELDQSRKSREKPFSKLPKTPKKVKELGQRSQVARGVIFEDVAELKLAA